MNKTKLIRWVQDQHPELPPRDVDRAIREILSYLADCLAAGDRIEIRDFGVFEIRLRPARKARNPRSGGAVAVPDRNHVHFRPGTLLRKQVQESYLQSSTPEKKKTRR
ncbi:MAG: integration host factor subunit beta [Acidithiobacillus sp.]|nr:integration host factor subunit beta [Acidithiobacillus sp.]